MVTALLQLTQLVDPSANLLPERGRETILLDEWLIKMMVHEGLDIPAWIRVP